MNKAEIIAILRAAPSREIKIPEEPKPVKHPTMVWLDEHGLVYSVSEDGTIVINDCIYLADEGLENLPVDFSMCTVNGSFNCHNNNLESLKGCPKVVKGYFECGSNKLTSLKGCPKVVKGYFDCDDNNLKNLKHITPYCRNYYTDFDVYVAYSDIPKELL